MAEEKGNATDWVTMKIDPYIFEELGVRDPEQIKLETPLGIEAKQLMDHGKFVSDQVVVDMIRDLIGQREPDAMFLFDGFPRTLIQAEKLDELVSSLEKCGIRSEN